MSLYPYKICAFKVKRTGTSLFFDLDVTHLRSADANRGWHEMLKAELVSFEQSTQGVAGT
jgi:hypothetical protein